MKLRKYISEKTLDQRVRALAKELDSYIGTNDAVLVANLKGSFMFFADIVRELKSRNVFIDFVATESYAGTESTGNIKITRDLSIDIRGKKVIVIEDIMDTGLTLSRLIRYIKDGHEPADVKVCVLLDKPSRRRAPIQPDFTGFVIEDKFVIGYGLDYNEKFRNLPYIATLKLESDQ